MIGVVASGGIIFKDFHRSRLRQFLISNPNHSTFRSQICRYGFVESSRVIGVHILSNTGPRILHPCVVGGSCGGDNLAVTSSSFRGGGIFGRLPLALASLVFTIIDFLNDIKVTNIMRESSDTGNLGLVFDHAWRSSDFILAVGVRYFRDDVRGSHASWPLLPLKGALDLATAGALGARCWWDLLKFIEIDLFILSVNGWYVRGHLCLV